MARIIFLNPFSRSEITGGIKTAHRHADLLTEMGFDAYVYQRDGGLPGSIARRNCSPAANRRRRAAIGLSSNE